jgi:hypothetical protein
MRQPQIDSSWLFLRFRHRIAGWPDIDTDAWSWSVRVKNFNPVDELTTFVGLTR